MFGHFIVWKQMTNWIASDAKQDLEQFSSGKTND